MSLLNKELGLEYCGGIEEIYNKLLKTFYKEEKDLIMRLAISPLEEKKRMVHSIKGLSYSIGIREFYDAASKQHDDFNNGIEEVNQEFLKIFNEGIDLIKKYIDKL